MGAVFLGTPAAAVPSLCALAEVADIDLVVTQPDRPAGRNKQPQSSPVKVAAHQFGFEVAQPETGDELASVIGTVAPNVALVVAYGRILRPSLLDMVPLGFLNIHFSLLPRWRGAAPVERAIAAGDTTTGVTLMKIDASLDTGPVLAERATAIADDETGGSLTARLAYIGARVVDDAMPSYLLGRRTPVPQIAAGSTHAKKLTKREAQILPTMSIVEASLALRAFTPRPGPWCATTDGVLKIVGFGAPAEGVGGEPGTVSAVEGKILLTLSDGSVEVTRVQGEGKPAMDAEAWMNGRRGLPLALTD